MKFPNFLQEKKLHKIGFNFVAGLDEAGRGPLAGPVTAAAVIFNYQFSISNKFTIQQLSKIKDSKKLTEKQREEIYKFLVNCPEVSWGVGIVSEKMIDKINILQASKLAMQKALKNLNADYLLLDGNFRIDSNIPQASIIKGDAKVFSIAAASIIAKVTRDRLMQKYHKKYPQFGFDQHKGYPTALHVANLQKFGPCKIHRKTFFPVSNFI